MIDYSALLYDPIYAELGVAATLTAGATVVDADRDRRNPAEDQRPRAAWKRAASGRAPLSASPNWSRKGSRAIEWIGAVLTFNGRTWIVREAPVQGSPNGEDFGEVRFLLKEAHLG